MLNSDLLTEFELNDFSSLVDGQIVSVIPLGGGRNSRVFKLITDDGYLFVGKQYFTHPSDNRNRLGVEFNGLNFLREQGVLNVPSPIAVNIKTQCAVYEYISGSVVRAGDIQKDDIAQAVGFLAKLKDAGKAHGSDGINSASGACFSIREIDEIISFRLKRLLELPGNCQLAKPLFRFLTDDFLPCYKEIIQWNKCCVERYGLKRESVLAHNLRTLSPSDFGFHNAIRRVDRELVFVDFEYLGWDDPAKMISDFLLHPGMELSFSLRQQFVKAVFLLFSDQPWIRERTAAVYPLYGLVWCLIILNEFIPDEMSRRRFSQAAGLADLNDQLGCQFEKARKMLNKVHSEYENFPYC